MLLQNKYKNFRSALQAHLSASTPLDPPDMNIKSALAILEKEEERDSDEDKMGIDEEGATPQDFMNILLRNATEEFGFAARDVYRGVFTIADIAREHEDALQDLVCDDLYATVDALHRNKFPSNLISHRVVSVSPIRDTNMYDAWVVNFKSHRIAKKAAEVMKRKEYQYLWQLYNLFCKIPQSSHSAGAIFESVVHRILTHGSFDEDSLPQVAAMKSNNNLESPTFTYSSGLSTLSPLPSYLLLSTRNAHRQSVLVDFAHSLGDVVTLDENKFYSPSSFNRPLFDSFIVHMEGDVPVISVFQITMSERHEGSAKGYPHLINLIAHVQELFSSVRPGRGRKPDVKVEYFLVCPRGRNERHLWQMPKGWAQPVSGDVSCILVPFIVA